MTDDLTIAPIEQKDIPELVALVNSAYRGESSKKGWTTEADLLGGIRTSERSLQEMLQKPGATMLTAKNETEQIVGTVYLQQQGHQVYLGMLTVAPDIQAKGIGKQLLQAAEDFARKINCSSIVMTVIDIRHELIDWYKRKGYQPTGEIKPFPTDPEFGIPKQPLQFIVLEKKLS
jgi:predicted N-acetyltransferase YhbS